MQFELPDGYININKKIIAQIKADIEADKDFHYLFIGVTGCGKTYLAKHIKKLLNKDIYNSTEKMKTVSCRKIYAEYLYVNSSNVSDKSEALKKKRGCLRTNNVLLDDIGDEKPKTEASSSFIEDIIEDRYEWIESGRAKHTIYTTNLDSDKLANLYGDRVLDRIYQHFTVFIFKKHSFRAGNAKIIDENK